MTTPTSREQILRKVENVAARYRALGQQIRDLEGERKKFGDWCKKALEQLKQDALRFDVDGEKLRALRYEVPKMDWNMDGLRALIAGKTKDLASTEDKVALRACLKITADEEAINTAVERGLLTLDEVAKVGSARKIIGFRVDVVKDEAE